MPKSRRRARPTGRRSGGPGDPIPRALPGISRDVHTFVRSINSGVLGAGPGFAWSFALSDLPSYTEFTSLFDQYRFQKVVLRFTVSPTAGSTAVQWPQIQITSDYDSASAPAASSELTQRRYVSHTFAPGSPSVAFTLKPRILADVGVGGSAAYAGILPRSDWVDLAAATLPWYGAIAWFNFYTAASNVSIFLEETYYFQCAGLR